MATGSDKSRELTAAMQRAAGPEKILWASHPDKARTVSHVLGDQYWGAIFLAGFAIFWITAASGVWTNPKAGGVFVLFPLFGLPFLFLGLAGLAKPWTEAAKAPNTLFAVTPARLLHVTRSNGWGRSGTTTKSIQPTDVAGVSLVDHGDSTGTIVVTLTEMETWGRGVKPKTLPLIGITNATEALALIEAMRARRAF